MRRDKKNHEPKKIKPVKPIIFIRFFILKHINRFFKLKNKINITFYFVHKILKFRLYK